MRAVAERARRSAEDYCNLLSDLFDGRAAALGRSLGIDGHTVEVFTEGQIRASVVFQSAKLASHLLRAARTATGEAGWDCLVAGEVVGAKLVSVPRLDPSDPTIRALTADAPAVLLVQSADGDEEVSTCGPGVAGILLCHALPHLSHLALRARQLACPSSQSRIQISSTTRSSLTSAPGVRFVAQPSNISLDAAEGGYSPGTQAAAVVRQPPPRRGRLPRSSPIPAARVGSPRCTSSARCRGTRVSPWRSPRRWRAPSSRRWPPIQTPGLRPPPAPSCPSVRWSRRRTRWVTPSDSTFWSTRSSRCRRDRRRLRRCAASCRTWSAAPALARATRGARGSLRTRPRGRR